MGRVSNTEEGNIQNLWYWLVLTSGKKVLLLDPGCPRVPSPLFRKLGATKHWYWQFLHILSGQTWSRAVDWIFYYGPEGSLIIHDILSLKPTNSRNYNSSNWCLKHSFPVQLSTSCPPELLQLVTDRRNGKAERQRVIIRWSLIQSNAARGRACAACDFEKAAGSSAEVIILPILHIIRNTYPSYGLRKR